MEVTGYHEADEVSGEICSNDWVTHIEISDQ